MRADHLDVIASLSDVAGARFALARALWESGTDRERSIAEAKLARDAHRRAGKGSVKALADVEAWLAEHG